MIWFLAYLCVAFALGTLAAHLRAKAWGRPFKEQLFLYGIALFWPLVIDVLFDNNDARRHD